MEILARPYSQSGKIGRERRLWVFVCAKGLGALEMDGWVAPRTFEVVLRFSLAHFFTDGNMRGIFFELPLCGGLVFDALAKLF